MSLEPTVTSKDVLDAVMEVRRLGRRAMEQLEALEPNLVEFALEEMAAIHGRMTELGWRAREVSRLYHRIESMSLVLVTAVRNASLRLWVDSPKIAAAPDPSQDMGGLHSATPAQTATSGMPDRPSETARPPDETDQRASHG
jgi:hypothetical protein